LARTRSNLKGRFVLLIIDFTLILINIYYRFFVYLDG